MPHVHAASLLIIMEWSMPIVIFVIHFVVIGSPREVSHSFSAAISLSCAAVIPAHRVDRDVSMGYLCCDVLVSTLHMSTAPWW